MIIHTRMIKCGYVILNRALSTAFSMTYLTFGRHSAHQYWIVQVSPWAVVAFVYKGKLNLCIWNDWWSVVPLGGLVITHVLKWHYFMYFGINICNSWQSSWPQSPTICHFNLSAPTPIPTPTPKSQATYHGAITNYSTAKDTCSSDCINSQIIILQTKVLYSLINKVRMRVKSKVTTILNNNRSSVNSRAYSVERRNMGRRLQCSALEVSMGNSNRA